MDQQRVDAYTAAENLSGSNMLVVSAHQSDKTNIAILSIQASVGSVVYITPSKSDADLLERELRAVLPPTAEMINLFGSLPPEIRKGSVRSARVLLAPPDRLDLLMREDGHCSIVQSAGLIIADSLQTMGEGYIGALMETILIKALRTRRTILGFCSRLRNVGDLARFLEVYYIEMNERDLGEAGVRARKS